MLVVVEELEPDDVAALAWAWSAGLLGDLGASERLRRGGALPADELAAARRRWQAAGRPPYEPASVATSSSSPPTHR